MKQIINDFISSIDTNLYNRIRTSNSDAECRRYLKEHLQEQLIIPCVVVPNGTLCDCVDDDETLPLDSVSNRRELLISYIMNEQKLYCGKPDRKLSEELADDYIDNL